MENKHNTEYNNAGHPINWYEDVVEFGIMNDVKGVCLIKSSEIVQELNAQQAEIERLKSERLDAGEAIGLVNWVIDTRPSRILTPDELIAAFRAAQNEKK